MEDIKEDNKLIASEFSEFIPEPVNVNLIALPEKKSNQITNYFSHV
jgi:hypothetical protein